MSAKKNIVNLFVAMVLLAGCNETLEDTYDDYAGDGKIRYVAKCTDFYATPGWERLILDWKTGTDATVKNIKLVYTVDGRRDSAILPKTTTSYILDNLKDGTYRLDICAVDEAGNESLKEVTYGRPYTKDHEIMRAFTRGVVKPYFLKNKLVFFSDSWNENIVEIKLQYKNTAGETKYYEFDKDKSYNALVTIDDVSMNPTDSVYIIRKGKLADSPDVMDFEKLTVSRIKNYSAGFVNAIQRRYGYSIDTPAAEAEFRNFIENAEELEFDYDMENFEDVLYCTNLKRLVLGKNRYVWPENSSFTPARAKSILRGSEAKSILMLEKAYELMGTVVHYYGNKTTNIHYFTKVLPATYFKYMGYPELPADLKVIDKELLKVYSSGNRIICIPDDPFAVLDNLLDDNNMTRWETTSYSAPRDHTMNMEFIEETEIRGIKVSQPYYVTWSDTRTMDYTPATILIRTSVDGVNWKSVTFFNENELGRGAAEVTLLPIAEGSRMVRYIKLTVRDGVGIDGYCMCKLGDIVIYK